MICFLEHYDAIRFVCTAQFQRRGLWGSMISSSVQSKTNGALPQRRSASILGCFRVYRAPFKKFLQCPHNAGTVLCATASSSQIALAHTWILCWSFKASNVYKMRKSICCKRNSYSPAGILKGHKHPVIVWADRA